jgi:hypothetical protein
MAAAIMYQYLPFLVPGSGFRVRVHGSGSRFEVQGSSFWVRAAEVARGCLAGAGNGVRRYEVTNPEH